MEEIVYVHGVVAPRRRSHDADYRSLRDGLSAQLRRRGHDELPPLAASVRVEWGYDHPAAGDTALLARAQALVADRVAAATPRDRTSWRDLPFARAVTPVRELVANAWADLVYYTSEDGKAKVREVVWGQVLRRARPDQPVDLTLVGHSAGSLIVVDFLFWLFSGQRDDADVARMGLDPREVRAAREHWRVRRLVTLGSPLTPLMVRSVHVTAVLAGGGRLDLADLGMDRPAHDGHAPTWCNVWDRHDVLAFPVAPFWTGGRVVDLYPDHSDALVSSHEAYWRSERVHAALAERWDD